MNWTVQRACAPLRTGKNATMLLVGTTLTKTLAMVSRREMESTNRSDAMSMSLERVVGCENMGS